MGDHQGIPGVVRYFFLAGPVLITTQGMFDAFLTASEEIWLPREANRARAFRIQCFTVANMAIVNLNTSQMKEIRAKS